MHGIMFFSFKIIINSGGYSLDYWSMNSFQYTYFFSF